MEDKPQRIAGPTPHGGTYALLFIHANGMREIVEFNASGKPICRIYGKPPATTV